MERLTTSCAFNIFRLSSLPTFEERLVSCIILSLHRDNPETIPHCGYTINTNICWGLFLAHPENIENIVVQKQKRMHDFPLLHGAMNATFLRPNIGGTFRYSPFVDFELFSQSFPILYSHPYFNRRALLAIHQKMYLKKYILKNATRRCKV